MFMKINNPEDPACQLLRICMQTQMRQNGGAAKNLLRPANPVSLYIAISKQLIKRLINDEHGWELPLIHVGSK